jgi:hypothetical protein
VQHLRETACATDCRGDGSGELVAGQVRKPAEHTGSHRVTVSHHGTQLWWLALATLLSPIPCTQLINALQLQRRCGVCVCGARGRANILNRLGELHSDSRASPNAMTTNAKETAGKSHATSLRVNLHNGPSPETAQQQDSLAHGPRVTEIDVERIYTTDPNATPAGWHMRHHNSDERRIHRSSL